MLHILGMVGKGIGIALLCILILLVVLLLAVLFVPIRYRIQAAFSHGEADGEAKAHWLFHIITATAVWDQKLQYRIKVFGITVYGSQRRTAEKTTERKLRKQKKKNIKSIKNEKNIKNEKENEVPRRVDKGADQKEEVQAPRRVDRCTKPRRSRIRPLKRLAEKIKTLLVTVIEKVKAFWKGLLGLFQKAEKLKETIAAYRAFFEREDFKRAFALCKKELYRVWKQIRPKKLGAELRVGFDDPAVTGQVLALFGMLYPFLGKDVRIIPDFENAVCEGKTLIKGRIMLFVLLRTLWILYFDKDIRRLIRIWKKEDALYGRE